MHPESAAKCQRTCASDRATRKGKTANRRGCVDRGNSTYASNRKPFDVARTGIDSENFTAIAGVARQDIGAGGSSGVAPGAAIGEGKDTRSDVRCANRPSIVTSTARRNRKWGGQGKRAKMRGCIHHIGAIRVDPHGLASRNGHARASRGLHDDCIIAGVIDEVGLLNRRNDEVPRRATSGTDQV